MKLILYDRFDYRDQQYVFEMDEDIRDQVEQWCSLHLPAGSWRVTHSDFAFICWLSVSDTSDAMKVKLRWC